MMLRDVKIKWLAIAAMLATGGCSYDGGVEESNGPAPGKGAGADPGRTFGISVGGSSYSAPATRAEYDGVTYRWTPGDRVGFYMVPEGGSMPVVSNARLKSVNTAASQVADFEGELFERDIERIVPDGKYDYYSYYPYDGATDVGFPNVAFNIPGEMTLTPDVFPVEYGFMVANRETTADGEKPLTWIEQSTGQQRFGKYVGFEYRHVFAYLEVYLSLNLMSQPVNKVVVTCMDGSLMSGTANINLQTGVVSFLSGSNSITVNIAGDGLNIWEDNGVKYTKVWIPINPALTGKRFRFDFYSAVDARNTHAVEVWDGPLVQGMKHRAGFKMPFFLTFQDYGRAGDQGTLTHRGYSMWSGGPNRNGGQGVVTETYCFWFCSDRGPFQDPRNQMIRLNLNTANSYGAQQIPTSVTVVGKRNGVGANDQYLSYGAIAPTATTMGDSPRLNPSHHVNITGDTGFGNGNTPVSVTFTPTNSAFGMKSQFGTWSSTYVFVKSIRIDPQ